MCFSPEASFASSALLFGIGSMTLKSCKINPVPLWVLIPFFFAWQQMFEGIVWLELNGTFSHSFFTEWAKNLYLIFALILWPVLIPLSMMLVESNPTKKWIMLTLLVVGIAVAYTVVRVAMPLQSVPKIAGYSIQFVEEGPFFIKLAYLACVSIPPIISSVRFMWVFGTGVFIACLVGQYFYIAELTSVWCFLSTVLAVILYFVTKANNIKAEG